MTWYSLVLTDDLDDASEEAWQLAWEVSQVHATLDHGNAIFKKSGPDDRLVLFFTPTSWLLAESFGATPCAKPSAAGLSLVAGSARARQIHFGALGLHQGIAGLRTLLRLVPGGRVRGREFDAERSTAADRPTPRRFQP
jgi:hypothetical protein